MRDLLPDHERLAATGPVGRAVVVRTWGSSPRLPGSTLLATADGRMAGSVSGGCVEIAVVEAVTEAIRTGTPTLLRYDVSHERAWEVGLACGGSVEILVEPSIRPELLAAARGPGGVVVPSVVAGAPLGAPAQDVVRHLAPHITAALTRGESAVVQVPGASGDVSLFLEVFPKPATLFVIGAGHLTELLVELAKPLGYRVVVADPREPFLSRDRMPGADVLLSLWPTEAFAAEPIDEATAVCVLSHDPKFDEPALRIALRSPAMYVGAIGSRTTQAERRAALLAEGFSESEVGRLHGPIGLTLGGRQPAEIALAILAQIVATRHMPEAP